MATESEPLACRLLIDPPGDGAWNMAVDEALLESAHKTRSPTLRFYSWSRPTLSLGYFQRHEDRSQHSSSSPCPLVRRSTGGGAILHDRELTYSFVWPIAGNEPSDSRLRATSERWLYALFHETLQEALAEFGVQTRLHSNDATSALDGGEFLCFRRRGPWDLLAGPAKIAGSAQRRRRGAVLQHGSVLLEKSEFAPELAGLDQLNDANISADLLLRRWSERLVDRRKIRFESAPLEDYERSVAREALRSKFASAAWTVRR